MCWTSGFPAFPGQLVMFLSRVSVLCLVALAFTLAGCSPRPTSDVLTPAAHAPSFTSKVRLLVATTRTRGIPGDPEAYGAGRSPEVNHAALTISIPRHHKPGQIEWPDQVPPDPAYHFLTTERVAIGASEFQNELRRRVRTSAQAGSVLVFVHGYNTLYQEAVYRLAQIVHDSGFSGTAVLFAWPSRGNPALYLADRDSTTYSRDYFESTLRQIAGTSGVREINILAHSMGSWLTMETLRQAKLKGNGTFGGKLGEVILASPDLDVNVLRTQLDVIGPLPEPMTILASSDDKVLALSALLAGGNGRAGLVTLDDPVVAEAARRYNVRVVDLTKVQDGTTQHHSKFAESGAVVAAIGRGLKADQHGKAAQNVLNAVTNVGTSLIQLPAAIVGAGGPQ